MAGCLAAKDAELGARAPVVIAKRIGRMEKVLVCMAFSERAPIVAYRRRLSIEHRIALRKDVITGAPVGTC